MAVKSSAKREPQALTTLDIALPSEAAAELVFDPNIEDERVWVPLAENVWSRPLLFNVVQGTWVNLTKAVGEGVVSRHRHPAPVTGYTLAGTWGYLEHDWTARAGTFLYEPAGETHTLVVRPEEGHMLTLFHSMGPIIYVDERGEQVGYDDVFTRLDRCKAHYRANGLGEETATRLIR